MLTHYIYFNGLSWINAVILFKSNKITLYGGSTTKRHIISPTSYRLGQFISCHDGAHLNNVVESFYLQSRRMLTPMIIPSDGVEGDIEVNLGILSNKFNFDSSSKEQSPKDIRRTIQNAYINQEHAKEVNNNYKEYGVRIDNKALSKILSKINEGNINKSIGEEKSESIALVNENIGESLSKKDDNLELDLSQTEKKLRKSK